MSITFTGLEKTACERLAAHAGPHAPAKYVPVDLLLQAAKAQLQGVIIWLYRAPWALPDDIDVEPNRRNSAEWLSQWLQVHRELLRKRRSLGKQLLLVNVEKVQDASILARLGLPLVSCEPRFNKENLQAVTAFLSQIFATDAPEAWDVFEALESIAWAPDDIKEVETDFSSPLPQIGLHILQLLSNALILPKVQAALADARTEAAKYYSLIDELEKQGKIEKEKSAKLLTAVSEATAGMNALRTELQRQDEQYTKTVKHLEGELALARQRWTSEKAEIQEKHYAELENLRVDFASKLAAARTETEETLSELYRTQEDLEVQCNSNRSLDEMLDSMSLTMDRARGFICQRTSITAKALTTTPSRGKKGREQLN